nr:thioredoxin domain-containing protein [Lysinibacter cavernae]
MIHSLSPYVRAHADNPVDWFPWGQEAFAEAARRDVPVLISIGYATCHWCHVMARESFTDAVVAERLNRGFVAIKVDREEHPEVDEFYLAAAGAFTSELGWPLNVFATPTGETFFAGTYSPPTPTGGRPSFTQVLAAVTDAWTERRDQVEGGARQLTRAIAASATIEPTSATANEGLALNAAEWARVVDDILESEDREYGGFGRGQKFPQAPLLEFLFRGRGELAANAALRSLDAMARSDLRDRVDGGFFRYATRRDWSVPHYERMLYDNAQLLRLYSQAGSAEVAAGIASFLADTLLQESGLFASAQDSESTVDGASREGDFYRLDARARGGVAKPGLDAKILSGWNGLAIRAYAESGARDQDPERLTIARTAADALLDLHVLGDGRLARASLNGTASTAEATLEDYGLVAEGLLSLAQILGEPSYASAAQRLVDQTITASGCRAPGGGDPVLRAKGLPRIDIPSEGASPSGQSAIVGACLSLYEITGDRRYRIAAEQTLRPLREILLAAPNGFGALLTAFARLDNDLQLVVVSPSAPRRDDPLVAAAHAATAGGGTLPYLLSEDAARRFADAGFGLLSGRTARDGNTTAYVCRNGVCRLPVQRPDDLLSSIAGETNLA